jgi:hypothetical protein
MTSQAQALLNHFKVCDSLTTIEARSYYGVLSVAARIFELRAAGHNIITIRETHHTHKSTHKNVARYLLLDSSEAQL